jgi:methyl-accepting chemotaxis protein
MKLSTHQRLALNLTLLAGGQVAAVGGLALGWSTNVALGISVVCTTLGGLAMVVAATAMRRFILNIDGHVQRLTSGDLSVDVSVNGGVEASNALRSVQDLQVSLRGTLGSIRGGADSLAVAAQEIAQGNTDLSNRTEQTASSLQQAASSMTRLTGTVNQTADSARTANQLASSASEVAARGGNVVAQVVTTMEEINQRSKKIADIIGTIDGIAFQTNILALNAAVEAARAGEQGRGFAVVASEVRSLAQRSAEAAREIKTLIGASVEKVESGSRLVKDAGNTMGEIVASVQRVSDIIGEISAAAAEQSAGIKQVSQAVTQLDQMTQQNAALVEESAAAAESLKDQSRHLAEAVNSFRLGGATGHSKASAAQGTAAQTQPAAAPRAHAKTAAPAAAPKAIAQGVIKKALKQARKPIASETNKPAAADPQTPPAEAKLPTLTSTVTAAGVATLAAVASTPSNEAGASAQTAANHGANPHTNTNAASAGDVNDEWETF